MAETAARPGPSAADKAKGFAVLAAILFVLWLVLGGPSDDDLAKRPIVKAAAEDLWRAYSDNEVAAQQRFANVNLAVDGTITDISTIGGLSLSLRTPSARTDVRAGFGDDSRPAIAKVSRGDRVSMSCSRIQNAGSLVMLSKCGGVKVLAKAGA